MENAVTDPKANTKLSLDEFAVPTYADWRAEAEAALKGAPFEKKLVSATPEGIALQPIYHRQDLEGIEGLDRAPGQAPFLRGISADNTWDVAQEIPYGLPKTFNQALRDDIACGQTAINIQVDQATRLGKDPDEAAPGETAMCGVSIATADDFAQLLAGIDPAAHPLHLQPGSSALPLLALLMAWIGKKGGDAARLSGSLDQDPYAELLADGSLPHSLEVAFQQMAVTSQWILQNLPKFGAVTVHAHAYHDAGGNAVQELGYALATGVEYLRQLDSRGVGVDAIAPRFRFSFSIGADFFMSIAKFRAARLLWSRIVADCGGGEDAQKMRIHARTSLYNRTKLDPWVNILRGTTEAFAAAAGGCQSMHVGAFDEVVRPPDAFSRRLARNTQIILSEECHFDQVVDPAGGSYFIENLTRDLAAKAWELFRETEKAGGIGMALATGAPQKAVQAVAAKKAEALAQRRTSLVGVNVYANATEKPLDGGDNNAESRQQARSNYAATHRTDAGHGDHTIVIDKLDQMLSASPEKVMGLAIEAASEGATLGELARVLRAQNGNHPAIEPLRLQRASVPFETLRSAVEAAGRPAVFLANMGPLRQHKARADFSIGFFEVGGFNVLSGKGSASVDEAAATAKASGAPVVVICSTDETYPEIVPALTGALKSQPSPPIVIVAGYPTDHIEAFKAAGVDDFIHLRANNLVTLQTIATRIGIEL